jgi:hypothetical protein
MAARLAGRAQLSRAPSAGARILEGGVDASEQFDSVQRGLGAQAPKFPAASTMELLLRRGETGSVAYTLRSMDRRHLRPGRRRLLALQHRRALDRPALREDALRQRAARPRGAARLPGHGDAELRRICEETLDWCLRDMRRPEGAFFSALTPTRGRGGQVLRLDARRAARGPRAGRRGGDRWLGARSGELRRSPPPPPAGAPGLNVLEDRGPRPTTPRGRASARGCSRCASGASRPGLDDKRLTAWNALLIAALADAGAVLGREDYLAAARDAAVFCCEHLREDGGRGRLLRTSDGRQAKIRAYLEDHAFLLEALLVLFEATGEPRWFVEARRLGDELLEHFATPSAAASSPPPTTATGSSSGARTSRTPRSPRAARAPRSGSCGWPR